MIQRKTMMSVALPPVVILGAVGLSAFAALASRTSLSSTTVVIAGVGGLVGVFVLLRILGDLGFGVSLIPFVAGAVPLTIGTGTQSAIVAGLLFTVMLLSIWILKKIMGRDGRVVSSPVNAPMLALVGVWSLAYLASDVDLSPFVWNWASYSLPRIGQLAIVIFSAAAFFLALNHGRNRGHLQVAMWSYLLLGIPSVAAFYAGHEGAFGFLSTGGMFSMWGSTFAYGQGLFNAELRPWARVGLVAFALAWIGKAMLFQTLWFSGWVPMVVAVAVLTLIRSRVAFVGLVVAVGTTVAANRDAVYHALWDAKVQEGDLTRLPIWAQAWGLVQDHLLLGTGPAGYAPYYQSVFAGSSYSMSTHSNYLDFVAQTGLVGSVIAFWFFATMLVLGWRARSRWQVGFRGAYAQAAFAGLLGLLVAMSLGDWFIPFVYNQTIAGFRFTVQSWVFLGYLASLAGMRPSPGES